MEALTNAVECDEYFAIAFYKRGFCYYRNDLFEEALSEFSECLKHLRDNKFIDYTQLGLPTKLYSSEVLFNIALCHFQLGEVLEGMEVLNQAIINIPNDENSEFDPEILYEAEGLREDCLNVFGPFSCTELSFKASEQKVKNTENVDYLVKAKVYMFSFFFLIFNCVGSRNNGFYRHI